MEISRSSNSSVQFPTKATQVPKEEPVAKDESAQQTQRNKAEANAYQSAQSRPVVNTQGQSTGRVLNVTA